LKDNDKELVFELGLPIVKQELGISFSYSVATLNDKFVVESTLPVKKTSPVPVPRYTRIIEKKVHNSRTYLTCDCDKLAFRMPCRHVLAVNKQRAEVVDFHFRHSVAFSIVPSNLRRFDDFDVRPMLRLTREETKALPVASLPIVDSTEADVFSQAHAQEIHEDGPEQQSSSNMEVEENNADNRQDSNNESKNETSQLQDYLAFDAMGKNIWKAISASSELRKTFLQSYQKLCDDFIKGIFDAQTFNKADHTLHDPTVIPEKKRHGRYKSFPSDKPAPVTKPKRKVNRKPRPKDVLNVLAQYGINVVNEEEEPESSFDDGRERLRDLSPSCEKRMFSKPTIRRHRKEKGLSIF